MCVCVCLANKRSAKTIFEIDLFNNDRRRPSCRNMSEKRKIVYGLEWEEIRRYRKFYTTKLRKSEQSRTSLVHIIRSYKIGFSLERVPRPNRSLK